MCFFSLPSEDTVSSKLQNNNVYTIAKRNVEGQDMLYQSLKLTNGIWILAELRIQPGNPNYTVRAHSRGHGTAWAGLRTEAMAWHSLGFCCPIHTLSSSSLLFLPPCSLCVEGDAVNLAGG